ncbi:MAG: hypothetical protein J6C23_09420 [Clostridia bacterium]|nr:hypothetical protein [Clostridia bacterium]
MKKKNRQQKVKVHDYSKYENEWNGIKFPSDDMRYYGVHKDGKRIKLDIKRMRKIGCTGVPESVLEKASAIPRNTKYFHPKKARRFEYVTNQFRDALSDLAKEWAEFKNAFSKIKTPKDVSENVRVELLSYGYADAEEATELGLMAGMKRSFVYQKLWLAQCSQFIMQIAVALDSLMLRKCRYLGFSEKAVTRSKLHTYLHGRYGSEKVENLDGYKTYDNFFRIYNLLKHNSEDLFEKVKEKSPEMLLTNTYHNGEPSMYYLKIGDGYIENSLRDLQVFYDSLCVVFFEENTDEAEWNYDDYFTKIINQTIQDQTNPLGI